MLVEMSSCVLLGLACLVAITGAEIVDLTHDFETNATWSWPGNRPFSTENEFAGPRTFGGRETWYESEEYRGATHGGTHMDAPLHLNNAYEERIWTIERIPPKHFVAPLRLINIVDKAEQNPLHQVSLADIAEHERLHGRIPRHAIVVMKSGWSKRWPDKARYFGPEYEQEKLVFPGYSAAAAQWLVENREPYGIGVDTASVDAGDSTDFPVHSITGNKNTFHLENLANLENVPEAGAIILAFPMKIARGSGAPCRVIAMWGDSRAMIGGTERVAPSFMTILLVSVLALYR